MIMRRSLISLAPAARWPCSPRRPSASRPASPIPPRCASRRPRTYKAKFDTSKGVFVIEVHARLGAERRRPLLQSGQERLLRQCPLLPRDLRLHGAVRHQRRPEALGAMARGPHPGRSGQAEQQARLRHLRDGRAEHPHQPGLHQLRRQRAASTARASRRSAGSISGMDVVDKLNAEYGEGAPRGRGPDQGRIQAEGNAYLRKDFPRIDFIRKATIEK